MNKEQFQTNINHILAYYKKKQAELRSLSIGVQTSGKEREQLDIFLDTLGLEKNSETYYAAYMRLSMLKEEALILYLDKRFSEDERKALLHKAYVFCSEYHAKIQNDITNYIEQNTLLTPFYLTVWKSMQDIGTSFNKWFPERQRKIIFDVNHKLEKDFENDGGKVMQYLEQNNLFDTGYDGKRADRCYSVLIQDLTPTLYPRAPSLPPLAEFTSSLERRGSEAEMQWKSISYREAFPEVIGEIISKLGQTREKLSLLEDDVFDKKEAYLSYFLAVENAFSETDTAKLVQTWGVVDTTWMQITTPLQPSHPLEYYEDNYRNSVAPEWDMRIVDTSILTSQVLSDVLAMYEAFFDENERVIYKESYDFSLASLKRVQLYISTPVLYYGAELAGLFSAQVVPNDKVVSDIHGKKIFAFPEFVLMGKRSQPRMKLNEIIFETSFTDAYYSYLQGDENIFYKVYDIETIGHEYGHTLWLCKDSDDFINKTGHYSNIEEWKATAGGLVAYFLKGDFKFLKELLLDHIFRSVGLMKYRDVEDIIPYYCEGIIHLTILFNSHILAYKDEKLVFQFSDENFEKLKNEYIQIYKKERKNYLEKKDAGEFLFEFVVQEEGVFLPKEPAVRQFVEAYYDLYKKIGNEVVE